MNSTVMPLTPDKSVVLAKSEDAAKYDHAFALLDDEDGGAIVYLDFHFVRAAWDALRADPVKYDGAALYFTFDNFADHIIKSLREEVQIFPAAEKAIKALRAAADKIEAELKSK